MSELPALLEPRQFGGEVRILALDPATKTGWAYGYASGPVVCGTYVQPKVIDSLGRWGQFLMTWLHGWRNHVDEIVYESPVPHGAGGIARRKLMAMGVIIEMVALTHKIRVYETNNNRAKARFYGRGGKKPAAPARLAKAWGCPAIDGDQADACAVFYTHLTDQHPAAATAWQDRKAELARERGETLL